MVNLPRKSGHLRDHFSETKVNRYRGFDSLPCISVPSVEEGCEPRRVSSSPPGPGEVVGEQDAARRVNGGRARTVGGAAFERARMAQGRAKASARRSRMSGINVGIDVAKAELVVAVLPSGESFTEVNDERAVVRLVKRLSALRCERIVLEASGGYETRSEEHTSE